MTMGSLGFDLLGDGYAPERVINTRDDEAQTKFWKESFPKRRCLMLATAFCEPDESKPAKWHRFSLESDVPRPRKHYHGTLRRIGCVAQTVSTCIVKVGDLRWEGKGGQIAVMPGACCSGDHPKCQGKRVAMWILPRLNWLASVRLNMAIADMIAMTKKDMEETRERLLGERSEEAKTTWTNQLYDQAEALEQLRLLAEDLDRVKRGRTNDGRGGATAGQDQGGNREGQRAASSG